MLDEVSRWLSRRSLRAADYPIEDLVAAKRSPTLGDGTGATTVSVVLPALDEEDTVGDIVTVIREQLMRPELPLVDELVVMDSGSTDRTAEVAAGAGAKVVRREEVFPGTPVLPGKGEVLWRSLAATHGDIVCFVDADLRSFSPDFVSGIVGPLLVDPELQLVKAMYDRPLGDVPGEYGVPAAMGGGRATELVARPLLNLHFPLLSGFVQPLGGEYAARRGLLERLPFPVGYGVEIGLLIDALRVAGLDALAQSDVGVRYHRHQDAQALGRMATAIYETVEQRLGRSERRGWAGNEGGVELVQFERATGGGFLARGHVVDARSRAAVVDQSEYRSGERREE
ncbi:glucosyl-3-phosphoglycerate synthase [Streptomyces sulphureus]|uniref:glucosyl-3-phosphoglycerate synthase n=1 Tax=Streptomyces sulphureus TaxID=47758 RepID=UPI0003748514|nr:glucosyl-3-phosphoglycerate synthase [Streptomyces sulphureus]